MVKYSLPAAAAALDWRLILYAHIHFSSPSPPPTGLDTVITQHITKFLKKNEKYST